MWFERAGIAASVVNLAKRATGPEYASSCKLVGRHTHLAHVDLVLFDFAINLQGACVATGAELELRPWRAGDRFHPSWKRAPIALKDFLRGQKLPLEERRALPLVCSGSDVLAVCAEKAHVGKPHAEGGGDARALWIVVQEAPGE